MLEQATITASISSAPFAGLFHGLMAGHRRHFTLDTGNRHLNVPANRVSFDQYPECPVIRP